MHESVVFGSGVLAGAGAMLLGVALGEMWRYVHTAHSERHDRPVVRVSWLNRIRQRRGTRVVMYSSRQQAEELAGEWERGVAVRPGCMRRERRASERPPEPAQGWADSGAWVDLGAPQEAAVRLLHGDTHRPERCGGVIRFRRHRGEAQR